MKVPKNSNTLPCGVAVILTFTIDRINLKICVQVYMEATDILRTIYLYQILFYFIICNQAFLTVSDVGLSPNLPNRVIFGNEKASEPNSQNRSS
jgi:hypothetical protein